MLDDTDDISPLVLDLGSGTCRAGFAGDDAPRVVFPTIVGQARGKAIETGIRHEETFVGADALHRSRVLSLSNPLERGIVTNWDAMETLLHHIFYRELQVTLEERGVVMSEVPLNPVSNREKMTQLMFETFQVPGFYMALQPILSLYSSGRGSGLLLDVGDGVSHALPIFEGHALPTAERRMDMAGRDLTSYLASLLHERGYSFSTFAEHEIVRDIKEKMCFCALDFETELETASKSSQFAKSYELPDGQVITIGNERFRCTEPLFQPSLIGHDGPGIHDMAYDCLMACDIDTRRDFLNNIILSGGSTCIPQFNDRLKKEIRALVPSSQRVSLVAPPDRQHAVWIGGSILASLSSFQQHWLTKSAYDEYGPSIVRRQCI